MTIKRILAVTGLSLEDEAVTQRAGELADAHGAALKLIYVPARSPLPRAEASSRLAAAARQLQERLEVRISTATSGAQRFEDVAHDAAGSDLLVVPWRQEHSLSSMLQGQPVQRLLRLCRCPVLVVRNLPVSRYGRILVAIDLGPMSKPIANLAAQLEPMAELELFHAIDTRDEAKLRSAEATEQAVRTFRERRLRRAQGSIRSLRAGMGARAHDVVTSVGRGDPARETAQHHDQCGSDLIVVGSRRRSAWWEFFTASVSHQVLRWTTSDVLIVPEESVTSTRRTAGRRLREDSAAPCAFPAGRKST